ncbi:MAG: hypothetical protein ACPGWS_09440, partial [Solirubrobacterales bacterium]
CRVCGSRNGKSPNLLDEAFEPTCRKWFAKGQEASKARIAELEADVAKYRQSATFWKGAVAELEGCLECDGRGWFPETDNGETAERYCTCNVGVALRKHPDERRFAAQLEKES